MFNSSNLKSLMVGAGLIASASLANAATFSLVPASSSVMVNDTISLDLVVAGIQEPTGAYTVNVDYDASLVSFQSYSFGELLGGPTSNFDSSFEVDADTFAVSEVSLLPIGGFNQPDTFTLATLEFSADAEGIAVFDSTYFILSDEAGLLEIPVTDFIGASVEVAPVPVPAALWLFASGLIGLLGLRKRSA